VFVGVTIRGGEPVGAEMPIRRTGEALARVRGAVSIGDTIGFEATRDYLVKNGVPSVGTAEQSVAADTTQLIRVFLGAAVAGLAKRQFSVCIDGVTKTAWFYATEPE